uniref:EGF-like domain-containing protein n=1 Tax=Eptatretus burgeri TaxID=7764 RepID=A0A8C4RB36_EPTBU
MMEEIFLLLLASLVLSACQGHDKKDPCSLCKENAICHMNRECKCKPGFVDHGQNGCVDKDECASGSEILCGKAANCTNTPGSFYCTCYQGYVPTNGLQQFIPNDGTFCRDVDECLETMMVCGEASSCFNNPGSFRCICLSGYQMKSGLSEPIPQREKETICFDVNECQEYPMICGDGGDCVNSPGSFNCTCPIGYIVNNLHEISSDDMHNPDCEDVNECQRTPGICGAGGICSNNHGSFSCTCQPGFWGNYPETTFVPDDGNFCVGNAVRTFQSNASLFMLSCSTLAILTFITC